MPVGEVAGEHVIEAAAAPVEQTARALDAMAESIEQQGRKHGLRPRAIEGMSHGQWVLMDFGDFVAHVFYEPVRGFYDLERLWARVPRVSLPAPVREETSMPASGS